MERSVDLQTFIRNIEHQLDPPIVGGLSAGTRFRDLADWTSFQALILLGTLEWDYGVTLSADEFRAAETVEALYEVVIGRMGK